MAWHLAIDLGAGSGRAILGRLAETGLEMREVHRFHYPPGRAAGHLRWDFPAILDGIRTGLRAAHAAGAGLETVGVDSWGVDYGLVDAGGRLLEAPIAYRDGRTDGLMDEVFARIPRHEIFARTGIQFLTFNTLYQLVAHVREGLPAGSHRLLMVPDLCHHALCGATTGEETNASTTQLLDVRARRWDGDLLGRLGLPSELLPDLVAPGTELGTLTRELRSDLELPALRVVAPATHDTGSAVAGTPLEPGWAYVSSGTWSLLGVERDEPLVSEATERANFTNEAGAAGTVRLLKNVMGLWILESCRKEWAAAGRQIRYPELLAAVARVEGPAGIVFPDHPRFFNPASMTAELRASLTETDQRAPEDPVLLARVVLDSLAHRYASVLATIEALTGRSVPGLHIVGGGCLNEYLNQATADATGKPVVAGPSEATAAGNLLLQAIASGEVASLAEARRRLARGASLRRFEPRGAGAAGPAASRYRELEQRFAQAG